MSETAGYDSLPKVAHFYSYGDLKAGYESIEGAQRHIADCDLFPIIYKLVVLIPCEAEWYETRMIPDRKGRKIREEGMYAWMGGIFFLFTESTTVIGKCKWEGDAYSVYPNTYKIKEWSV